MPRGDRTGPRGMGSQSGRGAGFCAGNQAPGAANPTAGRMSGGRGRGMCNWFNAIGLPDWMRFGSAGDTPVQARPGADNSRPAEQADLLRKRLDELNRRLDAIEKKE